MNSRFVSRCVAALAFALVVAPAAIFAQATPPAPTTPPARMEEEHNTGWKELDEFHEVMSASWHPVSRNNDLAPARAKADSLHAKARVWLASAVPAKCDTPQIRSAMTDVLALTERFARLVAANGADADVRAGIRAVHDRFHVVEEHCHP